jgi:hypothetical protein
MIKRIIALLFLVMLAVPGVFADHRVAIDVSPADQLRLPVTNIYDPDKMENEPIVRYDPYELDVLLHDNRFRKWNDVEKVCQTMQVFYGATSDACSGTFSADAFGGAYYPRPSTARAYAYATFTLLPPPPLPYDDRVVLLVDPGYPPFPPAAPYWSQYGWWP